MCKLHECRVLYTPEDRIDYYCAECGERASLNTPMFYIYVPSYGNSEVWDGEKFTRLSTGARYKDRKTAFALMRELNKTMFKEKGRAWARVQKINYKEFTYKED